MEEEEDEEEEWIEEEGWEEGIFIYFDRGKDGEEGVHEGRVYEGGNVWERMYKEGS